MNVLRSILLVLMFVSSEVAYASPPSGNLCSTPLDLSVQVASGVIVKVRATINKPPTSYPDVSTLRWGVEAVAPRKVFKVFEVMWADAHVFLPFSSYWDLTNPRNLSLTANGKAAVLVIDGGDAATSYRATLIFENGFLKRRKVVHGEFPDNAWEETTYSYNLGE